MNDWSSPSHTSSYHYSQSNMSMGKSSKKKEIAKEKEKEALAFDTMSDHDESGQLIGKRTHAPLIPYSWQQCALIGWDDEAKSSIWDRFLKNDATGHRRDSKHESRKLGVAVGAQTAIEILEQLCRKPEDLQNLPETLQLFFHYAVCALLQLQCGDHHERMKPEIDQNPVWEALFYRLTDKERCNYSVSRGIRLGCLSFIHLYETRHTFPTMISYANSFLLFKELTAALHQSHLQHPRSVNDQRQDYDRNSREFVRQHQFQEGQHGGFDQMQQDDVQQGRVPVGAGGAQEVPLGGQ